MNNNGLDIEGLRESLLDAALLHVAFDGWSAATLALAAQDAGLDGALVAVICPGGAADLAADYHRRGDRLMLARLAAEDLSALRFRDRVATALRFRLDAADSEVVRRGAALFAMPQHAGKGAALIWGTADAIWKALGDNSRDINWYTKRATLAAVYSAAVLYWLGDESDGQAETWAFLDRRIQDVMRFEKFKAQMRDNQFVSRVLAGPLAWMGRVQAPQDRAAGLPGKIGG